MTEPNPKWVDDLRKLHEQLPANDVFKEELRQKLVAEGKTLSASASVRPKTKRRMRLWGSAAAIAAIAAVILVFNLIFDSTVTHINAAALQLQLNSEKSLGRDPSVAIAIDNRAADKSITYYAIPDQGIFRQSGLSYTRIMTGNVSGLALSPDGKQLAYIDGHEIYVLQLDTLQSELVIQAPDSSILLSSVAWSPNQKRLTYVRHDPSTAIVMEKVLESGEDLYLDKGETPQYSADGKQLIYEKNTSIYTRDLSSGKETLWGDGRSPVISPDGKYILYVKTSGELNMEDVWIADLDKQTEQQITHNVAIEGWEKGEVKEGTWQPSFRVGGMSWSSDSQEVAIYQLRETNVPASDLVRYKLSTHALTAEEVVGKSIEALIYRDEAYAHSFFSYDPGYLKGTSPRQVGYSIVDKSQDEQGRWIITANIDFAYQFPFYSVQTMRFVVTDHAEEYKQKGLLTGPVYRIDDMQGIDSTTISTWGEANEEVVTVVDDQRGELLFNLKDVPKEEGWTNTEFGHLIYRNSDKQRQIWFLVKQSLSQTAEKNVKMRYRLMRYDWDQNKFHALSTIDTDAQSVMMIMDGTAQKFAIELQNPEPKYDIAILSLENSAQAPIYLSEKLEGPAYSSMNTRMWKDGKLSFFVDWNGRDTFLEYE